MSDMLDRKLLEKWIDDNYYEETDGECESSGLIIEVPALLKAIQSGALSPQDNTRQQEGWKATDEQVTEWAERHDIGGTIIDLRSMFEDARTAHLLPSPPTKQEPPHDHT